MALVDNPKEYILQLFKVEKKRYAPDQCQIFLEGYTNEELPLDPEERVYGIYSEKYFFSPSSLIVKEETSFAKIYWSSITQCSSHYIHKDRKEVSILHLVNGEAYKIRREELGMSSGKIGQLYYGMIERWGFKAALGHRPLSIEQFFKKAKSDDSLGPNRIKILPLNEMRALLNHLSKLDIIDFVKLGILEYSEKEPISDRVLIGTNLSLVELKKHLSSLNFSFVNVADENTHKLLETNSSKNIYECIWD